MVEATRELTWLTWQGQRVDLTQALNWPRAWAPNPDIVWFAYNYFSTTIIPQRVKDATCELAFQYINAGTDDVASQPSDFGVIEETVGPISTRYQAYQKPTGTSRYPRVMALIRPLLAGSGNSTTLVRG